MLEWPQSRSDVGDLKRGGVRRTGAKALLAAGLLAAASAPMVLPAYAQLKPDAPSVETPFGKNQHPGLAL